METKANHVLIGAFTLAVSVGILLFALWAAKYASERNWRDYDVIFKEPVTGLSTGGLVQYNGITVGAVRDLSLAPNDPRQVIARIRVEADTPIKTDTQAKLALTGLTGVSLIQLSGGKPESPPLRAGPDQEVPTIVAQPSALSKLFDSSEDIIADASTALKRINRLLSDENAQRVSQALANLEAATGVLADQREDIAGLIHSAREASARLATTLEKTDRVVDSVDRSLTEQLPELVTKLDRTLNQLEAASRNAEGILGDNREAIARFSQDGLSQVGPTLTQLRVLIRQVDGVLNRLEDNPAGFVFGRDQPEEFEP